MAAVSEDVVETHLPKLREMLRSRVLRVLRDNESYVPGCLFFLFWTYLAGANFQFQISVQGATFFSKTRGHIAGCSDPSPLRTVRALHFYREKISALSPLVDSRRIVSTHARRSQHFDVFFSIFANVLSKS